MVERYIMHVRLPEKYKFDLKIIKVANFVTVVAQWAKAPGINCYVAGSIPAVTPRYYTKIRVKCSLEHKKNKGKKKKFRGILPLIYCCGVVLQKYVN